MKDTNPGPEIHHMTEGWRFLGNSGWQDTGEVGEDQEALVHGPMAA